MHICSFEHVVGSSISNKISVGNQPHDNLSRFYDCKNASFHVTMRCKYTLICLHLTAVFLLKDQLLAHFRNSPSIAKFMNGESARVFFFGLQDMV